MVDSADTSEVYEDLGIVLEEDGFLIQDQRQAYVSMYVKVPNPVKNYNLCSQGCGVTDSDLDYWIMSGDTECKDVSISAGVAGQLENVTIDSTNHRETARKCLWRCLKDDFDFYYPI